mgnify:FL=1
MIRPRPLESSNKVQDLLDFQDTFQRGDTLEAMQMQQAPVQPMAMQPPPETMYMNQGGLVSLPIYNRSWGGMLGGLASSFVGTAAQNAGLGVVGSAGLGMFTGFLADKVMGKKTNLKRNLAQGVVPVGMNYLRGGPRNFLPEGPSQGLGYSSDMQPDGFGSRFIDSAGDQFTLDNLKKHAANVVAVESLVPEEEDEEDPYEEILGESSFGTQKFASVARDPNDPLEYDPRNPQRTQKEILDISRGRRRQLPKHTYIKTARGGGLAGIDFEGRVPGRSDGMEDDQYYAIREKGGPVEGLLAVSPKEYVMPADVMSILGNGNPDAAANDMDRFSKQVRMEAYGTPNQQKELDGFQTINSNLRG